MNELVTRIVAEHRPVVMTLVVALAVNVLAYPLVVRPRGIKSANAANRAEAAVQALRAAESELAAAKALVEGKGKADEELNAFYQKVLPSDLVAARRMTYASLPALARKTSVKYEARSSAIEATDDNLRLSHFKIRMVLAGEWEAIRDFVYELESAPEFIIIDDVTLAETSSGEPVALTIDLSTYFRPRPDGA